MSLVLATKKGCCLMFASSTADGCLLSVLVQGLNDVKHKIFDKAGSITSDEIKRDVVAAYVSPEASNKTRNPMPFPRLPYYDPPLTVIIFFIFFLPGWLRNADATTEDNKSNE